MGKSGRGLCIMNNIEKSNYDERSLELHYEKRGKIAIVPTVKTETKEDLSLAYTPGVAKAGLEMEKDID